MERVGSNGAMEKCMTDNGRRVKNKGVVFGKVKNLRMWANGTATRCKALEFWSKKIQDTRESLRILWKVATALWDTKMGRLIQVPSNKISPMESVTTIIAMGITTMGSLPMAKDMAKVSWNIVRAVATEESSKMTRRVGRGNKYMRMIWYTKALSRMTWSMAGECSTARETQFSRAIGWTIQQLTQAKPSIRSLRKTASTRRITQETAT